MGDINDGHNGTASEPVTLSTKNGHSKSDSGETFAALIASGNTPMSPPDRKRPNTAKHAKRKLSTQDKDNAASSESPATAPESQAAGVILKREDIVYAPSPATQSQDTLEDSPSKRYCKSVGYESDPKSISPKTIVREQPVPQMLTATLAASSSLSRQTTRHDHTESQLPLLATKHLSTMKVSDRSFNIQDLNPGRVQPPLPPGPALQHLISSARRPDALHAPMQPETHFASEGYSMRPPSNAPLLAPQMAPRAIHPNFIDPSMYPAPANSQQAGYYMGHVPHMPRVSYEVQNFLSGPSRDDSGTRVPQASLSSKAWHSRIYTTREPHNLTNRHFNSHAAQEKIWAGPRGQVLPQPQPPLIKTVQQVNFKSRPIVSESEISTRFLNSQPSTTSMPEGFSPPTQTMPTLSSVQPATQTTSAAGSQSESGKVAVHPDSGASTNKRSLRERTNPAAKAKEIPEPDASSQDTRDSELQVGTSGTQRAQTPISSEAGMGTLSPEGRDPGLRARHKDAERRRREEMRDIHELMRRFLMTLDVRHARSSKWELINTSLHIMQQQLPRLAMLETENERLRQQLSMLGDMRSGRIMNNLSTANLPHGPMIG